MLWGISRGRMHFLITRLWQEFIEKSARDDYGQAVLKKKRKKDHGGGELSEHSNVQGYLAHKKHPPPKTHHRSLGIGLL